MPHQSRFLTPEQFLLTLMAEIAIMAVLATMLVRFPWFRKILLTEKRDWPGGWFAGSLGLPLMFGVLARLLLPLRRRGLTLAGSFLAGLLAGPHAGAIVGVMVGFPPDRRRMDCPALCGRLRLRRRGPSRDLREGSDLALLSAFFTGLHRNVWRLVRRFQIDWVVICSPRRSASKSSAGPGPPVR